MAESTADRTQKVDELRQAQLDWERNWSATKQCVAGHTKGFIQKARERLHERWPTLRCAKPEAAPEALIRGLASVILDELCESPSHCAVGPPSFRTSTQRATLKKKQATAFAKGIRELFSDGRVPAPRASLKLKDEWDLKMRSTDTGMLLPSPKLAARELIAEALEEDITYLLHQEEKRISAEIVASAPALKDAVVIEDALAVQRPRGRPGKTSDDRKAAALAVLDLGKGNREAAKALHAIKNPSVKQVKPSLHHEKLQKEAG